MFYYSFSTPKSPAWCLTQSQWLVTICSVDASQVPRETAWELRGHSLASYWSQAFHLKKLDHFKSYIGGSFKLKCYNCSQARRMVYRCRNSVTERWLFLEVPGFLCLLHPSSFFCISGIHERAGDVVTHCSWMPRWSTDIQRWLFWHEF